MKSINRMVPSLGFEWNELANRSGPNLKLLSLVNLTGSTKTLLDASLKSEGVKSCLYNYLVLSKSLNRYCIQSVQNICRVNRTPCAMQRTPNQSNRCGSYFCVDGS